MILANLKKHKVNNTKIVMMILAKDFRDIQGLSWSWSYGSWIYNYLCNQCLSPWIFLVVLYSFQPKPLKTIWNPLHTY